MLLGLIEVERIVPDPDRVRPGPDPYLQKLRDDIRKHGLQLPIAVTDLGNGHYQIRDGHRRFKAFQGSRIPATIYVP